MIRNLNYVKSSGFISDNDNDNDDNDNNSKTLSKTQSITIDHEYKVIGLIQDCIMSNMYEEAVQLMQILIDTNKHESSYQRYVIELRDKFKATLYQQFK